MDDRFLQQLGVGAVCLIVGISGWVLPYRWNLLRVKRAWGKYFSEETNRKIPKVVGTVLVVVGLVVLIGTLLGMKR